ncbi:hypothetical protein ACQPW3_12195 [Actinosynnema sp. CA-248983]
MSTTEGPGMGVRRLLERVRARQAEGIVAVPVRSEEPVGDAPPSCPSGTHRLRARRGRAAFVPGEVYLEVRLRHLYQTAAARRKAWVGAG